MVMRSYHYNKGAKITILLHDFPNEDIYLYPLLHLFPADNRMFLRPYFNPFAADNIVKILADHSLGHLPEQSKIIIHAATISICFANDFARNLVMVHDATNCKVNFFFGVVDLYTSLTYCSFKRKKRKNRLWLKPIVALPINH